MKSAYQRHAAKGFTLVEVLVAIVVSAMVTAAIYQTFQMQQQSYITQTSVSEMQQSIRTGMYLLTTELRLARFNPVRRADSAGRSIAGFVTNFRPPNNSFAVNYANTSGNVDDVDFVYLVAFTADLSENGRIQSNQDNTGDGVIDLRDTEEIAYRYDNVNRELQRFDPTAVLPELRWVPVLGNVDAVDFVYMNSAGAVTTEPANIAFIEVSLLVRAEDSTPKYINTTVYRNKQNLDLCPSCRNDHYHRRLLTTTVQIRNVR